MKRNIRRVIILMLCCIIGIVALQIYWLVQHHHTIYRRFAEDVSNAFVKAADQEIDQRHQAIIRQFKGWLNDTSIIAITADINTTDSTTQFHIKDVASNAKNSQLSFGLVSYTQRLHQITPEAKTIAINHFADRILKTDLQQGMIYFYTKRLGDSLNRVFLSSHVRIDSLKTLFMGLLHQQNIDLDLKLDTIPMHGAFEAKAVNTDLRRPFQTALIYASFPKTYPFLIHELRSIIISSLLLIIIATICFVYTYRTMMSQYRLSVMKDNFVNNMTHELNTPIASIRITAEALKSFDHDRATEKEYLDIISHQSAKLATLTDKILEMRSKPVYNFESLDMNDVINQAIQDLRSQIITNGAVVNYHQTNVSAINGDHVTLVSVLTNIINNAINYGRGVITITMTEHPDKILIRVADIGAGIPKEYQGKVFDEFFRVPSANLHDVKGHGLGLSHVTSIIKAHHGRVYVSDNKPSGTIMTIELCK